jgi:hypothetical protein
LRPCKVVLNKRSTFQYGDLRRLFTDMNTHQVTPKRPAAALST